jgi:lysophospholipase L1-like esterase
MIISCSNNNQLKIDSIVCFGDSLTYGYGATEGKSYPYFLQQSTNITVINSGINGNTSKDALSRIDDILKIKNALVIIEFGANDFFQQVPLTVTKKNIEEIIDKLKTAGNTVVLVSTEDTQLRSYHNMFKNIAKDKGILFIDGILNEFWNDRTLFFDEIHPNSSGYKLIAEKIYKNIKHLIEQ